MSPERSLAARPHEIPRTGVRWLKWCTCDPAISAVICVFAAALCWGFAGEDPGALERTSSGLAQTQTGDVVVVLAGDEERWRYGQTLLQRGVASRLLTTLVEPHCQAELSPEQICATGVRNTVDEALTMRRILAAEHVQHAVVVTSDYHVLRAGAVFFAVFAGSGIQIEMTSVSDQGRSQFTLLLRELVMLGPSIGGALLGRLSPTTYEAIMQFRYR